jgi:hypothetical protein
MLCRIGGFGGFKLLSVFNLSQWNIRGPQPEAHGSISRHDDIKCIENNSGDVMWAHCSLTAGGAALLRHLHTYSAFGNFSAAKAFFAVMRFI